MSTTPDLSWLSPTWRSVVMPTFTRDHPVTDHHRDWCEHEMSSCVGGCPPYGYCVSDSHRGDVSPDWPCASALRALGETKAEWIAKHDAEVEAHVEWILRQLANG